MHLRFLGASALLFALGAAAPAWSADAAWLAAARAEEAGVVASLKEMVAIESGSGDAAGIGRMAELVEARLKALGAATERLPASEGHGAIVRGTLVGTGTKRLMLIAHMDTVYPRGILATQPIKQDGNRLYGPGIADDKGGIAVILHSLAMLKSAGWRDYAVLTVLFNADEEIGSGGSGEAIARIAAEHDYVLSCEPTGAKSASGAEGVLLGAAGTANALLTVTGRSSHAGAAPSLGRNALVELAHEILQTRDVAQGVPGAQLNWTTAQAGLVRNQIPETATAYGDVRTTQPDAAERLRAALQAKVEQSRLVPDTTTSIRVEVGRPPFVADERGRALARQAQAIYAELDGRPLALVPGTGAATDAGFAARSGKPVVLESFGLAGAGYHARDEYIEIDSIVPRLYLMTRVLTTVARP